MPIFATLLTSSVAFSCSLPLQIGDQFPPYPKGYQVVADRCIGIVASEPCATVLSVLRGEKSSVLVLSHLDHLNDAGIPINTVADILRVEDSNYQAVSIGNCRFDQEADISIVAIVDYSTAADGWTDAATWAKRVDVSGLKIRDTDPARVTCNPETPTP